MRICRHLPEQATALRVLRGKPKNRFLNEPDKLLTLTQDQLRTANPTHPGSMLSRVFF
jgi:hypothetical protein